MKYFNLFSSKNPGFLIYKITCIVYLLPVFIVTVVISISLFNSGIISEVTATESELFVLRHLPATTFSYGDDCDRYMGGCPLSSLIAANSPNQSKTANDFFLRSVNNGYKGRVNFEYWAGATGNALNVRYCDQTRSNSADTTGCKMDNTLNTQRHRIGSLVVQDGMGNSITTKYSYSAIEGLASVKSYTNFSEYEFLGYPEATVDVYAKNSDTKLASRVKTYYFQNLETPTCFKPSPLRGMVKKIETYDVNDLNRWSETQNKYLVRFGPMTERFVAEVKDSDLNATRCADYQPKTTITSVMKTDTISRFYQPSPALCTRSSVSYNNLDGSIDPYFMPHLSTDYGKVSCSNPYSDDTSDGLPKLSYTDYTKPNTLKWLLPKINETWLASPANSVVKYENSKIIYDNQVFGTLGNYGNITATQILVDGTLDSQTKTLYDTQYPWLVVQTEDPLGNKVNTSYDSIFHLFPVKVTNPLNHTVITDYDFNINDTSHPNFGGVSLLPVRIADANRQTTTYVYDSFGRILDAYLPGKVPGAGIKPDLFYRYFYYNENDIDSYIPCIDDYNCLIGLGKAAALPKMMVLSAKRYSDGGTLGQISVTHKYYDGSGSRVQERELWYENEAGNAGIDVSGEGLKDIVTETETDSLGNPTIQFNPVTVAPATNIKSTTYAPNIPSLTNYSIKYGYDGFNRKTKVTYPDGTWEAYQYDLGGDPLMKSIKEKNCNILGTSTTSCLRTISISNAFGQVTELRQTVLPSLKAYKTNFTYHPVLDVVTETKDTLGTTVNKIEVDRLGRTIKMWDIDMSPDMINDTSAWTYKYDAAGNIVRQSNPKGQTVDMSYDSINRPTAKKINGSLIMENVYDNCPYGIGRLCKNVSYNPQVTGQKIKEESYTYNPKGLLVKDDVTLFNMPDNQINGKTFTTEYTYDKGDRLTELKYPGENALAIPGETVTNTYNRSQISGSRSLDKNIAYVSGLKYNKFGAMTEFVAGNGMINKITLREDNLRLAGISYGNILNFNYDYDPNGNVVKSTSNNPMFGALTYTYSPLNQLLGVTGTYTANYEYDDVGNLTSKKEGNKQQALVYNSSNFYHRPMSVAGSVSGNNTFDKIGNLTSDGINTYSYDLNNRMVRFEPPMPTSNTPTNIPSPTATPELTSASTSTPTILSGDANGDGIVDNADYDIWLLNYGSALTGGGANKGDFNNDSKVDGIDYAVWWSNFGKKL